MNNDDLPSFHIGTSVHFLFARISQSSKNESQVQVTNEIK